MSNHVGGVVLNQVLHGLVEVGLLQKITTSQKKSLCKLLWRERSDNDCDWSKVIDIELAVVLSTCMNCRGHFEEICPNSGYCPECSRNARRENIQVGLGLMLCLILGRRFGALPEWAYETTRTASEENILRWGERLLQGASSLEEIFGISDNA